jgi:hypothetical protein
MSNQSSGRISRVVMCRDEAPYAWLWKFRALPTWFVIMAMWPLLQLKQDHPWCGRKRFALLDWYGRQTLLCRELDMAFWFSGLVILAIILRLTI